MNGYAVCLIVVFAFQWGAKSLNTVWAVPNEKAGEGFIQLFLWAALFVIQSWLLYEALQCRG